MEDLLKVLRRVTKVLEQKDIRYTLGGSGLLYALNLVSIVNDFDLTTDANKEEVIRALEPFDVREKRLGGYPFASTYLLELSVDGEEIEVIGGFSLYSEEGICFIPSIVSRRWNELNLSTPEAWYVAYTLMDRPKKAELLKQHLMIVGINEEMKAYFANTPVGQIVRDNLM